MQNEYRQKNILWHCNANKKIELGWVPKLTVTWFFPTTHVVVWIRMSLQVPVSEPLVSREWCFWGGLESAAALEEIWQRGSILKVYSFFQLPVHSVCFMFKFKDVISQFPAPATLPPCLPCHHVSSATTDSPSETMNQKKPFLLWVAMVTMFDHSKREITNTIMICLQYLLDRVSNKPRADWLDRFTTQQALGSCLFLALTLQHKGKRHVHLPLAFMGVSVTWTQVFILKWQLLPGASFSLHYWVLMDGDNGGGALSVLRRIKKNKWHEDSKGMCKRQTG